jgi:hypothetical protein
VNSWLQSVEIIRGQGGIFSHPHYTQRMFMEAKFHGFYTGVHNSTHVDVCMHSQLGQPNFVLRIINVLSK